MHDVQVTHPNRVLYEVAGVTKRELVDYFHRISPVILPYLSQRPLTLRQFPRGIEEEGFFRKHIPPHFPDYIKRAAVAHRDSSKPSYLMATADEVDDLTYLANQNVIELHIPSSTITNMDCPDQLIFDLDPMDNNFERTRTTALALREILYDYAAPAFVKTSGRNGLHVHVPITPTLTYAQLKPWVQAVGEELCTRLSAITTVAHLRRNRGHKVYVDLLRNNYAQTIIAPYSLRALKGAPIATPLDWPELKRRRVHSQSWNLRNIFRRLGAKDDPWQNMRESEINPQNLLDRLEQTGKIHR